MYGIIPFELKGKYGSDADKATYSLDNGPQVPFDIPGINGSITETIQDLIFFNVSNLSPGHHSLVVQPSGGGSTVVPLTLDYFHIRNVTSTDGTSSPNTAPIAEQISPSKGLAKGAIVGIAFAGAALFIILVTLLFTLLRRRRVRRSLQPEMADIATTPFLPPPDYQYSTEAPPPPPPSSHKQTSRLSAQADGSTVMHWAGSSASSQALVAKGAPSETVQYTYHEDSEGSSRVQGGVKNVDVPPQYIGQ